MALIITDATLTKAKLSANELLVDLACYLYDKKRLSMGQARTLTGLDHISFQKELAKRDIFIHYTEEDLNKDLKNLGIEL
jgi:predicted HTH domain antitoxin